jgi:hypothetical protein
MTNSLPGTFTRPAYPPPVPVGFIDPGGTTPVEHAFRVQQAVHQAYADWKAAHSRDIPPDVLKQNAGAFQVSDAALALKPALDAVKADTDAAHQKVTDAVKALTVPDGQHDAARRIWDRSRSQLDAVNGIPAKVAVAQSLIADADGLALGTLQEELPAYFATLKLPGGKPVPTDWLIPAFAARIPGLEDEKADAILKARQLAVLAQSHQGLISAIVNDTPPPPVYDPYSAVVTSEPYTNGEPYDPNAAK